MKSHGHEDDEYSQDVHSSVDDNSNSLLVFPHFHLGLLEPALFQKYSQGFTLSAEEDREVKRQKRLLKNREAAQMSRLRKKQYVEELEGQYDKLQMAHSRSLLRMQKLEDLVRQLGGNPNTVE